MFRVESVMYCPKCKENFEEGSRRFCPTDGARLISEAAGTGGKKGGGIFANLIPKIEGLSELDEALSDVPRFASAEPNQSPATKDDSDDIFFELEEIKPDPAAEPKPIARKVNPFEIPAGHVDLGDADRPSAFAVDFNANDPESFVGRTVKGRYKVTEFLGGDENGLAYLADDNLVKDKMVLVRILTGGEPDEIMDSILAEERVSLSHFSHPNIARLIDSGQFAGGTSFIISEYVDALSVGDILSIHGQFDGLRAARVIRQAASALNEAHQEGIIHRDLRPENIIIDAAAGEAEQVTIVNFGASNGDPTPRNFGYKAHEVLDGRIATIASDIFSLAVVAHEILTSRMPFAGETVKETVRSQNAGMIVLPTHVRPELPRAVDEVLTKAFSFNAAERYSTARDFGDAFYSALAEPTPAVSAAEIPAPPRPGRTETLKPLVPVPVVKARTEPPARKTPVDNSIPAAGQPAWKNRSPEPPQVESSRSAIVPVIAIVALLALVGGGWYYIVNNPSQPTAGPADQTNGQTDSGSPAAVNTEMPPMPRNVPQPPNTSFYQNSKQNLKGDLLRNFVGFTIFYPKDWKVNGPQEGTTPNARGKFLDISRSTADGRLKEQMLISYYPSKGTFSSDAERFPQMVKETNDTLKKLLPDYQMVSEGEIKINGDWLAYEIKFQAGGTSETGETLVVWGRRLFIPAARPGVRNGFEITMLATSLADEIRSVDDIGVKGELAAILYSFEPSQNF